MKTIVFFVLFLFLMTGCAMGQNDGKQLTLPEKVEELFESFSISHIFRRKALTADDIKLSRDLLYDKYTLEDEYVYNKKPRSIKWDIMKKCLAYIENMEPESGDWCVIQNYRNKNGEAPLVRRYKWNEYKRVSDTLGVERYQSVPLYLPNDTVVPERYGRDGTLGFVIDEEGGFYHVRPATFYEEWYVPKKYTQLLPSLTKFHHVIFVDRGDQNIVTVERADRGEWLVRSVNPCTTGLHQPPYAKETPLGMYLLQEKKPKMLFLKDGSSAMAGYAPYASRFTNGAYIHGVPVNLPATSIIEYSWTLGTTPRSHMCVRNASSHSKFVYDWAPVRQSLVIVIE